MNDPYQILNIPPTATDEEVKRAYRDLARKYHPDNYHDNPLADLAQEKMKEINEAYDQIQKQRKASSAASQSHSYGYGSGNSYGNSAYGGAYGAGSLDQVRMAINRGDISLAERLLTGVSDHNAEWSARGAAGWTRPSAIWRPPCRWTRTIQSIAARSLR